MIKFIYEVAIELYCNDISNTCAEVESTLFIKWTNNKHN